MMRRRDKKYQDVFHGIKQELTEATQQDLIPNGLRAHSNERGDSRHHNEKRTVKEKKKRGMVQEAESKKERKEKFTTKSSECPRKKANHGKQQERTPNQRQIMSVSCSRRCNKNKQKLCTIFNAAVWVTFLFGCASHNFDFKVFYHNSIHDRRKPKTIRKNAFFLRG